jgi:HEAT repeat protein
MFELRQTRLNAVMESCGKSLVLLFAASLSLAAAQNDLVPMPKLRPEDPSKFFPLVVRLDEVELTEVAAVFRKVGREDLALQVQKSRALRAVPPDVTVLTALLGVSSDRVKEWTLRGLGEHRGDKTAATPALLAIASDRSHDENCRALAVRVLGTTGMEPATVAKLADQIGTGSKEFSALILEVISGAGNAAQPVVPDLQKHLDTPEALVQYYAYQALQKLGFTNSTAPDLNDTNSPAWLRCVALQTLVNQGADSNALRTVIDSIGHSDPFISELAINVLQRMDIDSLAVLAGALSHNDTRVRVQSAIALRRLGTNAASAVPAITKLFERAAKGEVALRETGICLDVLRAQGTNAASANTAVAALLPEQSPIYRNVEKHEVERFRGFLFATLAEIGVPKEAGPFIADALANADDRMAYGFAGAARAAASLGSNAENLLPFLLRPLEKDTPQEFLDFDQFEAHVATSGEYTTCQIESLRALRRIGPAARSALPVVRAFHTRAVDWIVNPGGPKRLPRLSDEAQQTLSALDGTRTALLQSADD